MGKVIHRDQDLRKLGHVKLKNHLVGLLQGKIDRMARNKKRIDLRQQQLYLKELMLTLALNIKAYYFLKDLMK